VGMRSHPAPGCRAPAPGRRRGQRGAPRSSRGGGCPLRAGPGFVQSWAMSHPPAFPRSTLVGFSRQNQKASMRCGREAKEKQAGFKLGASSQPPGSPLGTPRCPDPAAPPAAALELVAVRSNPRPAKKRGERGLSPPCPYIK